MRFLALLLLAGTVVLSGCARHYVIRLNSGVKIYTVGKPKLKGASFYYKDFHGKEQRISEGSVAEVAPASMMKQEKDPFNPGIKSY